MRWETLIYNALVIIGVWEATGQGMLLHRPALWLKARIGDYWVKPLFDCPMCMASVWGIAFFFLHNHGKPLWHVLALCGLVKIIVKLVME